MNQVKVIDKMPEFMGASEKQLDLALGRMADDIQILGKIRVPYKEGDLQKAFDKKRLSARHHQVWVNKEYASYQERGRRDDGTRVVRNYTTPGTGKDFLKEAGAKTLKNSLNYLKQAGSRARV